MSFKPTTKDELKKAIDEYCENDEQKYGNINDWDVSLITDMSELFFCCYDSYYCDKKMHHFNQPINNWNVSNVTNMDSMFYDSKEFNQPINDWNVSNVTNMRYMFCYCNQFNQPINNWNVSNVTNMSGMFFFCCVFNQPLNDWNVSNVANMSHMFHNCYVFNQPINNWNVSNVANMNCMFCNCPFFNQSINNWNVSNVTNMNDMFYESNKTHRQKFYMMNIEKENRYALCELQKDMSIVKIYYIAKDKEFIIKNINNHQKNEIQNFIKNKTEDICELCYFQTDCVNNICVLCS